MRLHSATVHWLGRSGRMVCLLGFTAGRAAPWRNGEWLYQVTLYLFIFDFNVFVTVPPPGNGGTP